MNIDIKTMRTIELARALANGEYDDSKTAIVVNTSSKEDSAAIRSIAIGRGISGVVKIIECDDVETRRSTAFNEWQAQQVVVFLQVAHDLGKTFVIACDNGSSRSSAIAAAWLRINGLSDLDYWTQPEKYSPNLLVYRLILSATGIELSENQVTQLRELKNAMLGYRTEHAGGTGAVLPQNVHTKNGVKGFFDSHEQPEGEACLMNRKSIKGFEKQYFYLSNSFEDVPVEIEGIEFRNAEAAFQAGKARTLLEAYAFSGLDAASARKMGRRIIARKDWKDVCLQRMREVVSAKFLQNPDLAFKLLQTGDAELVDQKDEFWEACFNHVESQGKNNLGEILMGVRSKLRESIAKDWPRNLHYMKLAEKPYEKVSSAAKGTKLWLYDDKRRQIQIGDALVFDHLEKAKPRLFAIVTSITVYPDFATLFQHENLERCGCSPDSDDAFSANMNQYYSEEDQAKYNTCAIGFKLANDVVSKLVERRKPGYPIEHLLYLDDYDEANPKPGALYLLANIKSNSICLDETPLCSDEMGHRLVIEADMFAKLASTFEIDRADLAESSVRIVDAIRERFSCVDGFNRLKEHCERNFITYSLWRF